MWFSLKSYSGAGAELHKLKPNILDETGPAGGSAMPLSPIPLAPPLPPRFKILLFDFGDVCQFLAVLVILDPFDRLLIRGMVWTLDLGDYVVCVCKIL